MTPLQHSECIWGREVADLWIPRNNYEELAKQILFSSTQSDLKFSSNLNLIILKRRS